MGLLYLSAPVEFEPVSQLSSVFFDAERGQVFSVRGGGVTGVEDERGEDLLKSSGFPSWSDAAWR